MLIAVIAHDAGAANHIFAWVKTGHLKRSELRFCLQGPALSTYLKLDSTFVNHSLEGALNKAELVITGTGWASDLEHNARIAAHERNLKCIAVIDHWTNYRARFNRHGHEELPDQIWVTDHEATRLCQALLPEVEVKQQPNHLIQQQLSEIDPQAEDPNTILFVMEPIHDSWCDAAQPGEHQAFDFFMQHKGILGLTPAHRIIIKPHPSDPAGKHENLLSRYPEATISVDSSTSLSELISVASMVVGCQTYAMVIALHADKKVITALPPWAPPCVLPQENIIHLSSLVTDA